MRSRIAALLALALASACDGTPAPAAAPDIGERSIDAPDIGRSGNDGRGGEEPGGDAAVPGGGHADPRQVPEAGISAAVRDSRYTSIARDDCRTVETDRETGWWRARCAGVGGFRLDVIEGDARSSLDVLPPRGDPVSLGLSTMAGGAFSRLGPRVEWRSDGDAAPDALILRYEAFEFPDRPDRVRSYLVVAKLSAEGACVVATFAPMPAQNERARRAADAAAGLPCVEPGAASAGRQPGAEPGAG